MNKEMLIKFLEWMNETTQHNPMQLETDNDDIAEMFLASLPPVPGKLNEFLDLANKTIQNKPLETDSGYLAEMFQPVPDKVEEAGDETKVNTYDLTGVSKEEKDEFLGGLTKIVAKQYLSAFMSLGLKTHIEQIAKSLPGSFPGANWQSTQSDAVEFAEWVRNEDFKLSGGNGVKDWWGSENQRYYTTEQLYQLFKQNK